MSVWVLALLHCWLCGVISQPCGLTVGIFGREGLGEYYPSGSYIIRGNGVNGKVIFKFVIGKGLKRTTEIGGLVRPEIIKPFYKWNMAHWADDIRVPNYPLQLLS